MLQLAIGALILAVIAALFGFDIIASAFASVARIIFFILLVVFVVSLIAALI
jgi:uncharacterized membrane protein YtjA (UPF0391 family)